ncbi:MAG TPA: hypothetical protein VGN37_25240 [Actinocatenispora sp.]
MPDSLPGTQLWEPALNMLSSAGTGTAFPAVPDRSTVLTPSWLTDHHFTAISGGDDVVYTYGWGMWQAYANVDKNVVDPKTSSSAWQKFYDTAHNILNGTPRLPMQTDTAQWASFNDGTNGLTVPIQAVKDWLTKHVTDITTMRDSVAKKESDVQGQAADVMWQILDHFQFGMGYVNDQLQKGITYLDESAGLLLAYHNSAVDAWNKWVAGGSGQSFPTGIGDYSIPDAAALVSPLGCLNAMARIITFNQDKHHWNRGLHISVPDGFTDTNDLASWSFWQDIERGAKQVWEAKLKQLDDTAISTAFTNLVNKYRLAPSALQLTPPPMPQLDPGTQNTDDKDSNGGGGKDDDLNNTLNDLLNKDKNTVTPPPGTGGSGDGSGIDGGGDNTVTPPPTPGGGGAGGGDGNTPAPNFTPTPPPSAGNDPGGAGGTNGYLVPDGNGGYDFTPSSDFANGVVPAGAIPGSMVPGTGGKQTFQPSPIGETATKPEHGTSGYLVPDGKGGYRFEPASSFEHASDVPPGAVAGYQVNDGNGKTHFVPSTANDTTPTFKAPTYEAPTFHPPTFSTTPPPSVHGGGGGSAVHPDEVTTADSTGSPGTVPGSQNQGSGAGVDPATGEPTGGGTGAGGAPAGSPAGAGNNVPLYPPMAGGMGGMGGMGGGQQNQDRQRTTWLSEDEKVWGTDPDIAPAVLGRNNRRRTRDEEEYEYAAFERPGTDAGRPQRPSGKPRRGEGGTGDTTSV